MFIEHIVYIYIYIYTYIPSGQVNEVLDSLSVTNEAVGDDIDGDITSAQCLSQLTQNADSIISAMQNIVRTYIYTCICHYE